jgi:hypothetical protein
MLMPQPVITREKLNAVMSDGDWSAIEELRHRLWLKRRENVSDEFMAERRAG